MRTKPKLTSDQAMALSQLVFEFPEIPFDTKKAFADLISDLAAKSYDRDWFFMMVNPPRYTAVLKWLQENSRQPMRAAQLWAVCIELADRHDGNVPLDRPLLAAQLRVTLQDVSRLLGELVKTRGLIRERKAGKYAYRLNTLVATNLPKNLREQLQLNEPEVVGVTGLWPYVPQLVEEERVVRARA